MKRTILLTALVLVLAPAIALAQVVTYAFTAELDADGVTGTPNAGSVNEFLLDNGITTLTGTYSYDTSTPLQSFSAFSGSYATGGLTFDQFNDVPIGFSALTVLNNAGSSVIDGIADNQSYDSAQLAGLFLTDEDGTVFGGIGLPALLDLADFEAAQIEFSTFVGSGEFQTESSSATFDITEFSLSLEIPEPASLALLGLGGAALLSRRR